MANFNSSDHKRFVRFGFPPGATPKEIAEALQATRERIMAEKRRAEELKSDGGGGEPA